jgi:carnitine monooxygenase subunit
MVPVGDVWSSELPVNWKSIRDVDNEGYHVAMAHPALQDLYGSTYHDIPYGKGLSCAKGNFQPQAGRRWSVREYLKHSGGPEWLPEGCKRTWAYYGLFPNNVIVATPEALQFYQELPLAVERSVVRSHVYRRPQESRRERLARYLAQRIDRETYAEDIQLSIWSNESMKSSAFEGFYLSDLERGLRSHHDQLRHLLPVMMLEAAPAEPDMAAINSKMKINQNNRGRPT